MILRVPVGGGGFCPGGYAPTIARLPSMRVAVRSLLDELYNARREPVLVMYLGRTHAVPRDGLVVLGGR